MSTKINFLFTLTHKLNHIITLNSTHFVEYLTGCLHNHNHCSSSWCLEFTLFGSNWGIRRVYWWQLQLLLLGQLWYKVQQGVDGEQCGVLFPTHGNPFDKFQEQWIGPQSHQQYWMLIFTLLSFFLSIHGVSKSHDSQHNVVQCQTPLFCPMMETCLIKAYLLLVFLQPKTCILEQLYIMLIMMEVQKTAVFQLR